MSLAHLIMGCASGSAARKRSMNARVGSDALLVLVDDAERAARVRFLHEVGYTVTSTPSFDEARRHLQETPPRVLISDVRLGACNGLHLAILVTHSPTAVILIDAGFDAILEAEASGYCAHTW